MTGREASAIVGEMGFLRIPEGLKVPVRILDARQVFGRRDALVCVVGCEGAETAWVSLDRITLDTFSPGVKS